MSDIWGEQIYAKTYISHTKSFNVPVSIGLTKLAHTLNGCEILNTTNLPDFQYSSFQILVVHLHFGLSWSGGIPIVTSMQLSLSCSCDYKTKSTKDIIKTFLFINSQRIWIFVPKSGHLHRTHLTFIYM